MKTITNSSNRSLVNIIGVPVILSGIFYDFLFPYMVLIALLFCSLEYVRTINKLNASLNIFLFLIANLAIFLNANIGFTDPITLLIFILIFLFLVEILFLKNSSVQNIAFYILGILWLAIFFSSSLISIRFFDGGIYYTYLLFLSVWICDTFAFFFGSKFGKKKILPLVSPNKSWVGSVSGMIGSILFMCILYSYNIYEGWLTISHIITFGIIFGGRLGYIIIYNLYYKCLRKKL